MSQSFLQSKQWESFQQAAGYETFRVNGALLIKKSLPFGKSYFYAPHTGIKYQVSSIRDFVSQIQELAKKEQSIFLRIEPLEEIKNQKSKIKNFYKVADVQPSQTIILDLAKSEEELLAAMHPKTRYNIRLAEKKGVRVRRGGDDDFEAFWRLMSETTGRDGFRAHGREYYQQMLRVDGIELYVAEYNKQIIAAGIFIFYGDTVTYLHGASTHKHKEAMAPHALQWAVIKLAKQRGSRYYDFYGIDEKKWPGVTRFKRGFNGREVVYPGTYDVVFDRRWYTLYQFSRRLRRML